jgi:hypothetical protein
LSIVRCCIHYKNNNKCFFLCAWNENNTNWYFWRKKIVSINLNSWDLTKYRFPKDFQGLGFQKSRLEKHVVETQKMSRRYVKCLPRQFSFSIVFGHTWARNGMSAFGF